MLNLFFSGLRCKEIQVRAIELHFLARIRERILYGFVDFIRSIGLLFLKQKEVMLNY